MRVVTRLVLTVVAAGGFVLAAAAVSGAQTPPNSGPPVATSASPSAAPETSPSPNTTAPRPSATPSGSPFYEMDNTIDSTTSSATAFYYFQANRDGSAKVKQELRLSTTLWNDNAQLGLRLPYITRFPVAGDPYYSLGNIELGYSYNVANPGFNHSLEFRVAAPTAQDGVESLDTQLKAFYTTKWKFKGWAITYANEYDQTVIQPKGASYTSYYEGKLTLPDFAFKNLPGLNFSAFWNYRILVDSGGLFKDALGGTLYGNLNAVALSITDSWGVGANGLWKYKFEANATTKF